MRLTILKVDVEGTQEEVAEAVDMIVRQLCGRAADEDVPARNGTTAPVDPGCAAAPAQQADATGKDARPGDQGEANEASPSPVPAGRFGETEYEWHRETGTRRLTIEGLMNATGLTRQAVHNANHRQKENGDEWAKAKGYQFRKAVPAGSIENRPAVPPAIVKTAPEARTQVRDDTPRYLCAQRPGEWGYKEDVADLAGASVSLVRHNEGIAGAGWPGT